MQMQKLKPISLQNARLPRMLSDLLHSNQFLKILLLAVIVENVMVLGLLMIMATKGPVVITLGADSRALERATLPKVEDQIREGVKRYLEKRYQWEPDTVVKKLKESESFIQPIAMKAFQSAVANVAKFSVEKLVSQKVYAEKIEVDLVKSTALITGDRITSIQGMKAAGNLKLELTFESGIRTETNPWGLYITKEREE